MTPIARKEAFIVDADGRKSGRDPRTMSVEELERIGHPARSLLEAVRAKCLDCCNHQIAEVRGCTAVDCALWAFRMNRNPYRRRELTEEQRQVAVERLARIRAQRAAAAAAANA